MSFSEKESRKRSKETGVGGGEQETQFLKERNPQTWFLRQDGRGWGWSESSTKPSLNWLGGFYLELSLGNVLSQYGFSSWPRTEVEWNWAQSELWQDSHYNGRHLFPITLKNMKADIGSEYVWWSNFISCQQKKLWFIFGHQVHALT